MFEIEYLCPFVALGAISLAYLGFSERCIRLLRSLVETKFLAKKSGSICGLLL